MLRAVASLLLACSFSAALTLPAFADDDISKVNGSIRVEDGRNVGDLDSVNGSVRLGDRSHAKEISTVNGSVDVGNDAVIESAGTVNGRISIGARARVANEVSTVNGSMSFEEGSDVGGEVSNVNGDIRLRAAHLAKGIRTVNGDMDIGADSRIDGGLLVEKSNSWFSFGNSTPPRIVVGPRVVVQGALVFEREVELFISDSATVGEIKGATPVRFSGENP
jgi:predicted acyltransferase (DUF342 family)